MTNGNAAAARLLIADDQSDVLIALQILLKGEGFVTDAATSPAGVIEKLSASSYDLLLMDMNYARDTTSGREGLDLLSQVRRVDETLPVVVMTAWASIDLAVEAMRNGLCDFVQKPWDNKRLLEVLHHQLAAGRTLRDAQRKRQSELDEARRIQQQLMHWLTHRDVLHLNGCEFAGHWQPAREVSGDYCEAALLDDRHVMLCIGDVSGKGLPAALLMSNLQAAVRSNKQLQLRPAEIVAQINHIISENVTDNKFITFFYAVVDTVNRAMVYTNAGHNAPLLVRSDGSVQELSCGGTILGFLPDYVFDQEFVTLQAGDRLLLFTDGISEAATADGEEFGTDRLTELLHDPVSLNATAWIERISETISAFHSGLERDDRTMIVLTVGEESGDRANDELQFQILD